jgi:hypothetical protein
MATEILRSLKLSQDDKGRSSLRMTRIWGQVLGDGYWVVGVRLDCVQYALALPSCTGDPSVVDQNKFRCPLSQDDKGWRAIRMTGAGGSLGCLAGTGHGTLPAVHGSILHGTKNSCTTMIAGNLAKPDFAAQAVLGRRIHLR